MNRVYQNPFAYGVFVSGEQFYDRLEIRRDLTRYIKNGQNVLLYGPRRYGKSSLASDIMRELSEGGSTCVWFDFMKVNSFEHFVAEYAKAAYAIASRKDRNLHSVLNFFRALRPKLSLSATGEPSFGIDVSPSGATSETLEEVLSLPERLAGEERIVVFFDEFQEIERLSSDFMLERIFRSVIQRQKHVTYVFLGSKTHTLKRMFTDAARPFYESSAVLCMGKPPMAESVQSVKDRFVSCGLTCPDEVAGCILRESRNIPYYLQLLGAEVFDCVCGRGASEAALEDVEKAVQKIRRQKRDVFESRMESLSAHQRTLVFALAHEETEVFSDDYRARHSLGQYTTVKSAASVLMDRGLLECENGFYRVADPFFISFLNEGIYRL